MDLKRFTKKAKDTIDGYGGTDALKDDVGRAREAAAAPGSLKDKASAVREALTNRPQADEDAPPADEQPSNP